MAADTGTPFQTVWNNIFGGSQTQSSATPVNMNPATAALQPQLTSSLSSLLAAGGPPKYTGPLNAPIGPNETDILKNLMTQQDTTGAQTGSYVQDVLSGKYLPGQSGANPFLNAAIMSAQRPTLQGLETTLTQDLPGRFTTAGQFTQPQSSSAFDTAAALATRSVAQSMSDIASNMSFGAYSAERQHQDTAAAIGQQEVQTTIANLQAQALPRMIQELGIERGIQVFQSQTQALLQLLQTIGGVAAPVVANQTQSTGVSSQGIDLGKWIPGYGRAPATPTA